MRRFEILPADVEAFIENAIRRDAATATKLSYLLFEQFGMRRGKSWLAAYINKTLRPHMAEDARLERRLRLLKRELGDRPEVLAKVAADVMNNDPKPGARRRRRKKAAAR
jgi:hypothetical protein